MRRVRLLPGCGAPLFRQKHAWAGRAELDRRVLFAGMAGSARSHAAVLFGPVRSRRGGHASGAIEMCLTFGAVVWSWGAAPWARAIKDGPRARCAGWRFRRRSRGLARTRRQSARRSAVARWRRMASPRMGGSVGTNAPHAALASKSPKDHPGGEHGGVLCPGARRAPKRVVQQVVLSSCRCTHECS